MASSDLKPFNGQLDTPSRNLTPFTGELDPPESPKRTALDVAKDVGITALKGAVGLPQSVVGVADLVTGGRSGQGRRGRRRALQGHAGLPRRSVPDAQKAANQKVAEADGFVGTARAMLENPSTIATSVGESIPQMLGGAGVARGVLAAGRRSRRPSRARSAKACWVLARRPSRCARRRPTVSSRRNKPR